MEAACGLVELIRNAAQRVNEAEGHVPRLAGEDEEDGGELGAGDPARGEPQEEHDEDGEAEDRHRLQDVEQRDEDDRGAAALGGKGAVGEGEDERGQHGHEHPQRGSRRVAREIAGIQGDRSAPPDAPAIR